jgi:SAM-dependent methyltransferase
MTTPPNPPASSASATSDPADPSHPARRSFEELVAEADAVCVDGWDFSWLDGRATEQRPSWGYQRLMAERLAAANAALDLQTGGGEVLAGAGKLPPVTAATESWPPNIVKATRLLRPRGVVVVAAPDEPPLPFADAAFDLVNTRHPDHAVRDATEAGFEIVDLRYEELRTEFLGIGAVVYFLRKVIWMVPGFTVAAYRDRLCELHEKIQAEGPFVATTTRYLIEARKVG